MILKTWNMQGANHSTEEKWRRGVSNMLTTPGSPNVICLQEAGAVPESAKIRIEVQFAVPATAGGGWTRISIYDWGGTSTRPARTIVFHLWDVNGHRVNTGIVTKETLPNPANVRLAWPAFGPVLRPAVGVQVGAEWIFSFHANAAGGVDAQGILAAIDTFSGGSTWRVGGDFNRDPSTLIAPPGAPGHIPAGSFVCPPNNFTHPAQRADRRLDYFVTRGNAAETALVDTSIFLSDHWAVGCSFP